MPGSLHTLVIKPSLGFPTPFGYGLYGFVSSASAAASSSSSSYMCLALVVPF
jgi:hypothetical protein